MSIQPLTLTAILNASRICMLRDACVTTLKARYPFATVKSHPGKVDISDIVAGTLIDPPGILVAVTRVWQEARLSQSFDDQVQMTAFVVVENDTRDKRLVTMDEIGLALCRSIAADLGSDLGRWGIDDVDLPNDIEVRPLLTAKSMEKGTGYYTVTWYQTLVNIGPEAAWAADWTASP